MINDTEIMLDKVKNIYLRRGGGRGQNIYIALLNVYEVWRIVYDFLTNFESEFSPVR